MPCTLCYFKMNPEYFIVDENQKASIFGLIVMTILCEFAKFKPMKTLFLLLIMILSNSIFAGVPKGVRWHKGSIEKAFALAKEQNKPLFLYWGAVWCPPCNHIKKKVFTNSEFKKEMKSFIPVYLDGDTKRAQIWGDKLKASGYPTMLVMSPQGKELMRFPTSISAKKYTELLRSSIKRAISIELLVKKKKPTDEEWSQLAFYSWGQNRDIKNKSEIYKDLFGRVPPRLKDEKASLFLKYLGSLSGDKEAKAVKAPLKKEFLALLNNKNLSKKFSSDLSYSGSEYIDYLFEKINKRVKAHSTLKSLMQNFSEDKSLSVEERLFSLAYEMNIAKEDKDLLPSFQKKLLRKVKETDELATDGYTRQDAMSTAIWMLQKTKLLDDAKKYAERELNKSIAPYYFMSYLASIEKELGNIDGHIEWKRKAWKAAKGGSTRFQWGTSYLLGLIENNKKKGFSKDFKIIIGELLKQEDAFNGRNKKRIERLQKALTKLKDKTFNLRIKAVLIEECAKVKEGKSCHKSFKALKLI